MSEKMITVKMPLEDAEKIRGMLVLERIFAEGDFEDVADLHNGLAVSAAKEVLCREIAEFERIIGFLDEALDASGERTTLEEQR